MNNKYVFGAAIVAVSVLFSVFLIKPVTRVVNTVTNDSLGAVSGPDSSFPCESHNGITRCFNRSPMAAATTTVCAFKSPAATSTLMVGSASFRLASSTATTVTLAKSATFNSTSTALATIALAAGAQGTYTYIASSSPTLADRGEIFAPNQYFVVGVANMVAGATGVGAAPLGSCSAEFIVN